MLSFPLSIFLIPYAIFILIIAFFAIINLKNIMRFRAEDVYSFGATFIFLAGLAIISYFSYQYLSQINWTEVIELGLPGIKINF